MLKKISTRPAATPSDLVDRLLECHERIRHFVSLAHEAGARTDASSQQVVEACESVERYFTEALPLHVADEEESLVPRLRSLAPEVDDALEIMERQHRQHEPQLATLLDVVRGVRADPRDETRRSALAEAAARMKEAFAEHLALEESVLFPAIRRRLSKAQQAAIIDELRARRR